MTSHLNPDKEACVLVGRAAGPRVAKGTVLGHTQVLPCVLDTLKGDIIVWEGTHSEETVLIVFLGLRKKEENTKQECQFARMHA